MSIEVGNAAAHRVFHEHFDSCEDCADNPFNLCAEGSRLLNVAAGGPGVVQHVEELNAPGQPGCICFACVTSRDMRR